MLFDSTIKLSSNLKKLIAIRDITVSQLAKELGEPQPTIFRIVYGKTQRPKSKIIKKMAAFFNTSTEELVGDKEIEWGSVGGWINSIISKAHQIPLCSWVLDDNYELQKLADGKDINISIPLSDKAFALKIKDTSMEPLFPLNSIIVCDPQKETSHGSYVIIAHEDDKNLIFRKLLQDMRLNYIKPLSKDFGSEYTQKMGPKDKVFATVVHVQYNII